MNFYRELLKIKDEKLEEFVKERITNKEIESTLYNEDDNIIGYCLNHNPKISAVTEMDENNDEIFSVDINCFHSGFIKLGTKIVYGMAYDYNGICSNDGRYYYIDDESYIYDFCKMIKNKEIINEYELMDYILEFIRNYFGYEYLQKLDREEMFTMLKNKYNNYYDPINEHGLSWFKGKGNALCSEYSILAQNILTIFGIDSYLIIGREKTGNDNGESHAFNIIDFIEEETDEEIASIVDFSNFVNVYNINFEKCGESPFIAKIKNFDEDFVQELINNEKHLCVEDFAYIIINNNLIHLVYDRNRDYYIANELIPDSYVVKSMKKVKQK